MHYLDKLMTFIFKYTKLLPHMDQLNLLLYL